MKNNIINIKKELIKKKIYIKKEIKSIILKSIINNKNLNPIIRANALYKISKYINKTTIAKQKNNVCLKTGRIGGVYTITNLSRHYMKNMFYKNELQNIKIKN